MAVLRSLLLLFIVFSMGNAQVNSTRKCPYGWTNFGVRCFKFFSQTVHWVTAERNCQSLGGNLASVHSKIEHDFLLSLLPSSSTLVWIGTHDGNHEGQWLWTDGTPYDLAYFGPGQPDNLGGEHCGELNWTGQHEPLSLAREKGDSPIEVPDRISEVPDPAQIKPWTQGCQ